MLQREAEVETWAEVAAHDPFHVGLSWSFGFPWKHRLSAVRKWREGSLPWVHATPGELRVLPVAVSLASAQLSQHALGTLAGEHAPLPSTRWSLEAGS